MKNRWRIFLKNIETSRKNNMFFLLVSIIIICVIFLKKNIYLETELVSFPDSWIEITSNNEYIEQTWAPNVKTITGLKVPFRANNSFTGILEAKIFSDNYKEEMGNAIITYDFIQGNEGELVFSFENLKVDIGSRYRFQVKFLEKSEEGSIEIPARKDSVGVVIDGKEIGKTAAFKVIFEKNSRIFWLISSFFPFFVIALFMAIFYNRKVEDTLGLSFIAVVIILFAFGLFEQLQKGILFIYLISIFCFVAIIVLCNKKEINVFKFFTPGIALYGGIVAYVTLTCHDLFRREWDEYSHWGLAVKDMFYYDAFAKHVDSSVWLQRYPPFSTLIEYFFTYNNEMFSEGILYVAYLALLFSLLIIVFNKCIWKDISYIAATGIIIILLPMVFFDHYYFIYVDLLLGVLWAYILVCYFSEESSVFNTIRICGGLTALVLIKDMGLVLACLFVIVVGVDLFYTIISDKIKFEFKKFTSVGIFSLATILPFIIWQIYIVIPAKSVSVIAEETGERIEHIGKVSSTIASSKISVKGLLELVNMQAPEYKYQIIKDYIKVLFVEDTFKIGNINFSYIFFLLVIIIGVVYLYKKEKNSKLISFAVASIIVSFGYAIFLLVTYLFSFPLSDAVVLHSHRRYLASCIGGIVITFWGILLLDKRRKTNTYKTLTSVACAILIFCVPVSDLYPENLDTYITAETIEGYDEIEKMARCFADKSESIYYIYNDSRNGALEQVIFRNYASPLESSGGTFFASEEAREKEEALLDLNGETEETLVSKNIKTIDEWKEELKEYEYVFLHRPGYVFAEYYGLLFEDPTTIDDMTYYRVDKQENTIELRYMGKVHMEKYY